PSVIQLITLGAVTIYRRNKSRASSVYTSLLLFEVTAVLKVRKFRFGLFVEPNSGQLAVVRAKIFLEISYFVFHH
ncbi:hypothetical protein BgiBS90_004656, partial [Biomphalaria glabrata]